MISSFRKQTPTQMRASMLKRPPRGNTMVHSPSVRDFSAGEVNEAEPRVMGGKCLGNIPVPSYR